MFRQKKKIVLMNIHEYANEPISTFNTKLRENVYALIGTNFVNLCWMKAKVWVI